MSCLFPGMATSVSAFIRTGIDDMKVDLKLGGGPGIE